MEKMYDFRNDFEDEWNNRKLRAEIYSVIIREIFILIVSGIPAVWTLLRKQLDFEDS